METSYRLGENVCKAHKHLISCDQKHESHFIKGFVGGKSEQTEMLSQSHS